MSLRLFILRRLLYMLPTMVLVTIAVFSILQLIPGNPADALIPIGADEKVREATIKEYGFDLPLPLQYLRWISKAVRGDLGRSILLTKPVSIIIGECLPRTIYLAVGGMFIAICLSFPLGIFAAVKRKTWVDYSAQVTALVGLSLPAFWAALMLMLLVGLKLKWLPVVGYTAPTENFLGFLYHLILPAFTLGLELIGVQTRMTRSTMLEELNKDYVQTHRSQGLPERRIVGFYALKNAMIPTLTIVSLRFAALLGGTAVIESIFAYPGIGQMILSAIRTKDYPVVQGGVLILSFTFIFINLIVDILYKWLDPRIKLE
jgi:peptide/nickel transport system permease protein